LSTSTSRSFVLAAIDLGGDEGAPAASFAISLETKLRGAIRAVEQVMKTI
jgi:hypothetical protein